MEHLRRETQAPDHLPDRAPAPPRSSSAELVMGGPRWIEHLRPAGNRAITRILTRPVQRQDEEGPVADAAPAEAAPLLTEVQIGDARRYYTAQPWLYTPAIIAQLRTALGLDPDGGVDDALVLAVAEWQSTFGAANLALVIDGKAGPRTLPRIFPGGLNVEGEGETFGGEAQTEVVDEWATLATPEARRDKLVELVNRRLVAAGVPPVTPEFDPNANNLGSFNFPTWAMFIGRDALGADSISEQEARDLADTVYHEARHTEQWFRMAQLRASQGLSAAAIARELGIEARIALLARAEPLVRGSMEALIAQGWWDSVYGAGSAHREGVLTELDRAGTALTEAQARFDANPTAANQAALDRAIARREASIRGHEDLPEENDAWATGPTAAAGITGGSPEPAGSPPPADGPAHGTLPEENLPVGASP